VRWEERVERRIRDLERRLARVIQIGVVHEADYEACRLRVRVGEEEDERITPWIPWGVVRAGPEGTDQSWWAPEVGEQVMVWAPEGDLAQAIVGPSLYADEAPAPAHDPKIRRVLLGGEAVITYYREEKTLEIDIPDEIQVYAGGDVHLEVGGLVTAKVEGDVSAEVGGSLSADVEGDVSVEAGGDINMAAGGDVNVTGTTINLN